MLTKRERDIKLLEERDTIRNKLMEEATEDRVRDIIHKYIVKPKFDQQNSPQKLKEYLTSSQKMEETVGSCEQFLK